MCISCAQSGLAAAESIGLEQQTTEAVSIAAAAVMLFSLAAPMAAPATTVKAGAVCTKTNQKVVKSGKTFICKKSGKKLIWQVQKTKTASSTTTPSTTPQPEPPIQPQPKFEDNYQDLKNNLDSCRLNELRNITGAGPKGFPYRNKVPHLGTVKIAIIPVDFSNAVGIGNPGEMLADDLKTMVDWSNHFSRNKMTYQPHLVSSSWLRAPKGAEFYVCVECDKGAKSERQPMRQGFQELINLADPIFDFKDIKFVYFVFPFEAESKYGTSVYFHRINLQSNEGTFEVSAYGEMAGFAQVPNDRSFVWPHLIHEILHFQGLIGHGPFIGTSIMSHEFGPAKSVTSWEAFLASWFAENEIICIEKSKIAKPVYVTMDSLDILGDKPVSTMVKISNDEVLVIEKRSNGPYTNFDNATNYGGYLRGLDNFTAYFVKVNEPYIRADWNDPTSTKANFWKYVREGNQIGITKTVSYQGITIEVVNKNQVKLSVS